MFYIVNVFKYRSTWHCNCQTDVLAIILTALCMRLLEGGASVPKHAAVRKTFVFYVHVTVHRDKSL
jgi:hypothetical protein